MASGRAVNVINLGRMGFLQALSVQTRQARQHLDALAGRGKGQNTLLLVEHSPVFTVGIRAEEYDEFEESRLKNIGAEFYRTNRGGLITFHGPGQLVAYPILNLRDFQPSMKWYIDKLESTIINTCRRFGVEAGRTEHTGVWVQDRKIAAIGVHGSRYITTHGVAINCDTDLNWFRHIVPCGINGKAVTSLTKELSTPTPIKNVIRPFLAAFSEEFEVELDLSFLESSDSQMIYDESDNHKGENSEGEVRISGGGGGGGVVKAAQQSQRWMSTSASAVAVAEAAEESSKVGNATARENSTTVSSFSQQNWRGSMW